MRTAALALSLAVAGCSTSSGPGAPEPVAPVDVVVVRDLAPIAGATVVFGDASGALVATATTDTSGRASSVVDAASVTVIDPGQTTRLFTVAHVVPGDAITIPLDGIPNP